MKVKLTCVECGKVTDDTVSESMYKAYPQVTGHGLCKCGTDLRNIGRIPNMPVFY